MGEFAWDEVTIVKNDFTLGEYVSRRPPADQIFQQKTGLGVAAASGGTDFSKKTGLGVAEASSADPPRTKPS